MSTPTTNREEGLNDYLPDASAISLDSIATTLVSIAWAVERIAKWCDQNPAIYLKRLYGAEPSEPVKATNGPLPDDPLKTPCGELDFRGHNAVRIYNCLNRAGIKTLGDLTKKTPAEMLRIQNFGSACLLELKRVLATLGLSLAPRQ